MTHDYKAALGAVNKCKTAEDGCIAYGAILAKHMPAIEDALQLAQEAEQLRKERYELARAVLLADYQGVSDDVLELAKKVRGENA